MVDPQSIYVVNIVGAESSGKTALARQLAMQYKCPWVPEYAREFLTLLDRPYHAEDLEVIAEMQWQMIQSALNGEIGDMPNHSRLIIYTPGDHLEICNEGRPLLFVDGGMLNLRIWAKLKYNRTIRIVESALEKDVTSLYILCRPVLPWEADPLREAPALLDRAWIYNQYLKEILEMEKSKRRPELNM